MPLKISRAKGLSDSRGHARHAIFFAGYENFCESLNIARNKRRLIIHSPTSSSITLINCDHRFLSVPPSRSDVSAISCRAPDTPHFGSRFYLRKRQKQTNVRSVPSWIISTLKMKVVRWYLPAGLINPSLSLPYPPSNLYIQPPAHYYIERWHDRCDSLPPPPSPRFETSRPVDLARLTISALSQFHWTLFIGGAWIILLNDGRAFRSVDARDSDIRWIGATPADSLSREFHRRVWRVGDRLFL